MLNIKTIRQKSTKSYRLFSLLWLLLCGQAVGSAPVATVDWTVAETLVGLGVMPIAVGDAKSYQHWVIEPKLADRVLDLGLRNQPNPEQLALLAGQSEMPLQFIHSDFYTANSALLGQFGRVDVVNFYQAGEVWQNVVQGTQKVADLIGTEAKPLLDRYWQKIAEIKPLVGAFFDRPIALVQFIDSRHLRIYGKNSLIGATLDHLGGVNAWQGEVNYWGFNTVEITALEKLPVNSRLVVIKPYPVNVPKGLQHNRLWTNLPLAKDPLILPAVWTFGAIPSALRFVERLQVAIETGGEGW